MSGREAIELDGLSLASIPKIKLDPNAVPLALRSLIPLAEKYGISDDLLREMALKHAGPGTKQMIRAALLPHEGPMGDWLAGPAVKKLPYSSEYIAFSSLWMI